MRRRNLPGRRSHQRKSLSLLILGRGTSRGGGGAWAREPDWDIEVAVRQRDLPMIVNQRRYSFGAVALGLQRRSVARMNVGWQRAKKNMLRGLRGVWLAVLQKVDFLVTEAGDCLGAEGGYVRRCCRASSRPSSGRRYRRWTRPRGIRLRQNPVRHRRRSSFHAPVLAGRRPGSIAAVERVVSQGLSDSRMRSHECPPKKSAI